MTMFRLKNTGCVAVVLVLFAAGCHLPAKPETRDAVRLITGFERTYGFVQDYLRDGDVDGAYQLFTGEFKKERAPELADFKRLAAADSEFVADGSIHASDCGYDWAWVAAGYGDKYIHVYFVVVDEIPGVGKMWLITTYDHYCEVKKSSSPKKTVDRAIREMVGRNVAGARACFTPYVREKLNLKNTIRLLYHFMKGTDILFEKRRHCTLWVRKIELSPMITRLPKAIVMEHALCFVKRGDKWLIAALDEFNSTNELYGNE